MGLALVVGERLGLGDLHAVGQAGVQFPQGFVRKQLGTVHRDDHVGAEVLDGLEAGEWAAKGDAVLGVLVGHLGVLAGRADDLGTQQGSAGVQHFIGSRPALVDFADDVAEGDAHTVQGDLALGGPWPAW